MVLAQMGYHLAAAAVASVAGEGRGDSSGAPCRPAMQKLLRKLPSDTQSARPTQHEELPLIITSLTHINGMCVCSKTPQPGSLRHRVCSCATPAPGRRETGMAAQCLGQRWGTPGAGWRRAPLRTATAALEQPQQPAWQTAAVPAVFRTALLSATTAALPTLCDDTRADSWLPLRTDA